jgi:cystathionine beta-lyase
MTYDFDAELDLRGKHLSKFDGQKRMFGTDDPDVIPMWVADMDFRVAPAVLNALQAEIEMGVMGYFTDPTDVNTAFANWMYDRHGWDFDPSWTRYTHGVISGYGDVIQTYSDPGDGVIVFSPVYHAFYRQIKAMGRVTVESQLVLRDGQFHMDLDALAAALSGREKILTLCSPHNPGGRVWDAAEIRAVAAFCKTHDLILVSDEIHMDLCFPGVQFVPTAVAAPDCSDRLVVLTGASKGFNIAGCETGILVAPDAKLRSELDRTILDRESSPNRFAMPMIAAAFAESGDWSEAVRAYIAENFRILEERLGALPGVSVMPMQATYLAWVDFSALGMSDAELMKRLLEEAKVAPSPGPTFGTGGVGHARFNVALPRPMLLKALDRIETAFGDIQ